MPQSCNQHCQLLRPQATLNSDGNRCCQRINKAQVGNHIDYLAHEPLISINQSITSQCRLIAAPTYVYVHAYMLPIELCNACHDGCWQRMRSHCCDSQDQLTTDMIPLGQINQLIAGFANRSAHCCHSPYLLPREGNALDQEMVSNSHSVGAQVHKLAPAASVAHERASRNASQI